uniref:Uncharacterized protein n=1 Tax=Tanacetum cinerariifolium TaxID=118510 RepID=A0A699WF79_TANCI|nr:hypothetical protein [Tanacetum cinerariifolium]
MNYYEFLLVKRVFLRRTCCFKRELASLLLLVDISQSREVHTSTFVTQIEALQRDVSTLQGHQIDDRDRLIRHIQHVHAQRDAAPEDGDSCL